MAISPLICPHCGSPAAPGARYCATCGEPVDPALFAELNTLYTRVQALDEIIAAGDGGYSVQALRDDYVRRYLAGRQAPAASAAPGPAGVAPSVPPGAAPGTAATAPAPAAAVVAPPASPAAPPIAPVAPAQPAVPRPVFSWRAFLADQAIAIMAYLGGFLLLVATLSFEVGAWQVMSDAVKLAVVIAVYLAFGVLGFALRRSTRLRTVGRAYLGVFALMTPLVALAAYRFELRGLGFPVAGMLCVSAAYAAIVYLALAWRTDFPAYAYLGWAALILAALAIPPWAEAPREWMLAALALGALMPLLAAISARVPAILREPTLPIAAVASGFAAPGTVLLGVLYAVEAAAPGSGLPSAAAFAAAAGALVPLALGWAVAVRRLAPRPPEVVLDLIDWTIAAAITQAAIASAAWLNATHAEMSLVLSVVALAQLLAIVALRRFQPARFAVRYAVEALALVLALVATILVWGRPLPNTELVVALSIGALIAASAAVIEMVPWIVLVAGAFVTPDYYTVFAGLLPPATQPDLLRVAFQFSLAAAGFALALWAAAMALSTWHPVRSYAAPLYVIALINALNTLRFLPNQNHGYQTAVLAIFAIAALAAARRENQPYIGGLVVGFFALLAVLPFTIGTFNGWTVAATMLAAYLVALVVRVVFGTRWAIPFYIAALGATIAAAIQLNSGNTSTASAEPLEVSFAAVVLLLAAALATVVVLWERRPELMSFPGLIALAALLSVHHHGPAFVLVLAIAAAGGALRIWRGAWWGVALYGSAALGSIWFVLSLADLLGRTAQWQTIALLIFATAAFALAALERQPVFTAVSVLYALTATARIPGPDALVPTLAITFVAVAVGVALRLRVGRLWALAPYAVAIQASLFAVLRVPGGNPGLTQALLLVFAAVAYAVAMLEGTPLAGAAPAVYGVWAALVQPDAHALLPLALLLAALGFAIGRVAGPRWSWPAYLAAAAAAGATAVLGSPHPGFEALALLALAVAAYLLAVLESRADLLPLPLVLGVLSLASATTALGWREWQAVLAFAALGWLYYGGAQLWRRLPGLRPRPIHWPAAFPATALPQPTTADGVRRLGARLHEWAGIMLGTGTALAALLVADAFAPRRAPTEAVVIALLALASQLALQSRQPHLRLAFYAAALLAALAISWQARWLGASNTQAYVLAPGSVLIVAGALAPSDARLPRATELGRLFSLAGAALLLLPTLGQSFATDPNWLYALILAVEALALVIVGVGTRSRLLVLAGSLFVGAAALRGAALAVDSGVPIPLVIGGLALLLMGGATWLSLRVRQPGHSQP